MWCSKVSSADSRSTLGTPLWAWSPMCGLDLKSHKMFIAPYDIPNNIHLVCVAVKWAEVTPDLFCGHLFEYGAGCVGGINKSSLRDHPGTIAGLCWKFQVSKFKTVGVVNFTPKSASKIYSLWIHTGWPELLSRSLSHENYTSCPKKNLLVTSRHPRSLGIQPCIPIFHIHLCTVGHQNFQD